MTDTRQLHCGSRNLIYVTQQFIVRKETQWQTNPVTLNQVNQDPSPVSRDSNSKTSPRTRNREAASREAATKAIARTRAAQNKTIVNHNPHETGPGVRTPSTFATRRTFMADSGFKELYIEELKDIYNAENQLLKALPKMAKAVFVRRN